MLHPRHIKAILVVPECTKKQASIPTSEQQGRASLVAAQAALAIQKQIMPAAVAPRSDPEAESCLSTEMTQQSSKLPPRPPSSEHTTPLTSEACGTALHVAHGCYYYHQVSQCGW